MIRDIIRSPLSDVELNPLGESLSRQIPTLTGTESGQLSSVLSVTSGDTVRREISTTNSGARMFLFGHSSTPMSAEFDAGDLLQLVGCTATVNGVAVADGADISAYQAGKVRMWEFTATGSFSVGYLNQDGSGANFFIGEDLSFSYTISGVTTNIVFDSGSTVEQYARGSDTLKVTFTNFTSANWNRYTKQRNIAHQTGTIAEAWTGYNIFVDPLTLGDGWTAEGGSVFSCDGTQVATSLLQKTGDLPVIDDIYLFDFTVDIFSVSGVRARFSADVRAAVGRYTEVVTATSTAPFALIATSTFEGTISNTSVRKLLEVA